MVKAPQPIDGFEIIIKEDDSHFEQIDTRSKRDNVTNIDDFNKKESRKGIKLA